MVKRREARGGWSQWKRGVQPRDTSMNRRRVRGGPIGMIKAEMRDGRKRPKRPDVTDGAGGVLGRDYVWTLHEELRLRSKSIRFNREISDSMEERKYRARRDTNNDRGGAKEWKPYRKGQRDVRVVQSVGMPSVRMSAPYSKRRANRMRAGVKGHRKAERGAMGRWGVDEATLTVGQPRKTKMRRT